MISKAAFCLAFALSLANAELNTSFAKDAPLLLGGLALQGLGQWSISQGQANPNEGHKPIFPWDKPFIGTYHKPSQDWSNYLSLAAAPMLFDARLSGFSWKRNHQELLLYAQALSLNSGLNLFVRSFHFWRRPETFHNNYDWNNAKPEAMGSFYSGHASAAFAVATIWTMMREDRNQNSYPWLSYGLATGIASLRVSGGKHYPSDILVGAAVGSFIGWSVSKIHQANDQRPSSISLAPPLQFYWSF